MIDKGYLLGGRYKIISVLGEGGMANVYLAEDIILQRKVAVKVLRLDLQKDPQTIQRFQREAQSTSDLSHPHIVSILDVGSDHNQHYLVMEYVDGPDLEEYIQKNSPIPFEKVINIMDQILSAMALAHKHNVIHRDLKPQNILIDKNNGNIKIVDFGIAVALNQSTMTQTNTAIGSVHYMSPEQARGSMATKQSDIYSLGIMLYELLIGKVPFTGENAVAVALKHFQEKTPSLKAQNPKIPQSLENVVLKATAKDPRDRYSSVLEMKEDLDTSLDSSRADEPPFKPQHDPDQDKTIVLPALDGSVHDNKSPDHDKENSDTKNKKKQKPTLWDNIKQHKWWWIIAIIAFLGIMITLIVALDRKDDVNVPDVSNMSQAQAKQELVSSGLKVGSITKKYSNNVKKNYVVRSIPGSGSTLKLGRIVDLVISKGQYYVTVPNIIGDSYESARKRLVKDGFKIKKEETYSFTTPKGNVISQDIGGGQKVNPTKTTITLLVSKGAPVSRDTVIKLKDLTGYSLKGAQDYARDNKLNLNLIQEYSDEQKNTVIKQSPSTGTELHSGDTITLTISKGKEETKSSDSSEASGQDVTVTKSFTIPYQENNDEKGNHVQIYISDAAHSLNDVYRDLYITKDRSFSIPFDLSKGAGHVKIVRDGKTLLDEDIDK